MKVSFTKMHGLGNDFVVFDGFAFPELKLSSEDAQRIADRQFGIGCDQILHLVDDLQADARMEIWNPDGSQAEMCGNGIRAAALFLQTHGPNPRKESYQIQTGAGLHSVALNQTSGGEIQISVEMGQPEVGDELELEIDGQKLKYVPVKFGNPHAIIFVDNLEKTPSAVWGREVEHHPIFPDRTNVEFVQVIDSAQIQVVVWERGAGLTLACGSGASAAAAVSILQGKTGTPTRVFLPGGELSIEWNKEGPLKMLGPATEVFQGEIEI